MKANWKKKCIRRGLGTKDREKTYSSIDRCSKFKGLLLLPLQATTNEEVALQGDEKKGNRKWRIQSCSFEWAPIR